MFRKEYGVDLGNGTVKIYSHSKNKSYIEKNMVAIKDGKKIIAVGNEAYEMFEKSPDRIQVDSPMAFGTISNIETMEAGLYTIMRQIDWTIRFGSIMYFSVPMDLTQIEKRAYYEVANGSRLQNNKVYIVERPIADAIGIGIPFTASKGSMLINIGAQSTEMSIVCGGKAIISKIVPIGGKQVNVAICNEIRKRCQLNIGTRTARRLKTAMGYMNSSRREARKVVGIDSISGLPREEVITSAIVNNAIAQQVNAIGEEIKTFLERTPPQIAYHVAREGIYLAGGSTRLPQMDKYLAAYTGYGFNLSPLYETSTIYGLEKVIKSKELQKWASPIKQRKI